MIAQVLLLMRSLVEIVKERKFRTTRFTLFLTIYCVHWDLRKKEKNYLSRHIPLIPSSNRLCDGTCHFSHHASWSTSTKCFTDTNFSVKDAPLLVQYNMMVLWWSINVPIGRNSAPLTTGRKLLWVFAQDASGRRWPTGRWRGWWRARWGSCVSSHRGIPQP